MLVLQDAPGLGAVFRNNHAITPALQPGLKYSAEHSVIVGDEHMATRTIPRWFQRMERRQLTSTHCPAPEDAAKIFPDFGSRIAAMMAEISGSKETNTRAACSRLCLRPSSSSSRAFWVTSVIPRYPNSPFMLCAVFSTESASP